MIRYLPKRYAAYVRASIAMSLQHRAGIFASAVATLFWILLLTNVWAAAYRGRSTVAGFTLEATVVYLTLANVQSIVLNSPLAYVMAARVRTGEVLFDVSRPIGYPGQMLALQAGQSIVQIGVMVVVLPVAALLGGISGPADRTAGLLYPIALLLGWLLNALLAVLIGLSSFWTVDNNGLATLYRFVATFLAGASVPLTFFPGPLRIVAEASPFRFIVYEPASIYVGGLTASQAWHGFGLTLGWIALLAGLIALVWRRAYRNVVVHGG